MSICRRDQNLPDASPHYLARKANCFSLRISIEPKIVEEVLEALASLDFPVNPQLYHRPAQVVVEFPAYSTRLGEVGALSEHQGLKPDRLR